MPERVFEAWEDPADSSLAVAPSDEIQRQVESGILSGGARKLFEFKASSHEEAMAIFNIRVGFGPYTPKGDSAPCPSCGASYWPKGSAECWQCGYIG